MDLIHVLMLIENEKLRQDLAAMLDQSSESRDAAVSYLYNLLQKRPQAEPKTEPVVVIEP